MGAWPVYYVWPMPSHFIFESPDNWLNTHKADWRWTIIIMLIGRGGQSRGQRALAGGVLDFTHRIPTPQCTLGFVKRNYSPWPCIWACVDSRIPEIEACICSEIRARYHPNPTPDRWPLESLPLGSETGIQVSAVVGIGDHLGRQLPVSLLVPVSVASVDTTLLPTKFWRRNGVEPEVGALVSILKFGNPQASVIGIGGRLEGSGSLSPSERWFHYS